MPADHEQAPEALDDEQIKRFIEDGFIRLNGAANVHELSNIHRHCPLTTVIFGGKMRLTHSLLSAVFVCLITAPLVCGQSSPDGGAPREALVAAGTQPAQGPKL